MYSCINIKPYLLKRLKLVDATDFKHEEVPHAAQH